MIFEKMIWRRVGKNNEYKKSYSQCGEDLIIDFVLNAIKIDLPKYIDIGANHPQKISNTYYFYEKGSSGVVVEPNSQLLDHWKKIRPRDTRLGCGVGSRKSNSKTFYVMDPDTLSSFSKNEAERLMREGAGRLVNTAEIPMIGVNELLDKYGGDKLDLLSLDTEGHDELILGAIDWQHYRPKIICVESIIYSKNNGAAKNARVINLVKKAGYQVWADTFINTIFVNNESFEKI